MSRRLFPSRRMSAAGIRQRIRRPRAHWVLLGFFLVMILLLLLVQGLTTKTLGASATTTARGPNNTPLCHGTDPTTGQPNCKRPILHAEGGSLSTSEPTPGRQIALTFDDGPDPTWTPRVIAVLRGFRVPATFFVVGSQVSRHPDLVRAEHRFGFEIGNHTFTHADLSTLPLWQRKLQLQATESAVAGAIGIRPRMMRPPYSATPSAMTLPQYNAILPLAQDGYLVTLSDYDAEDWMRPGVSEIVRNVIDNGILRVPGRPGGIVLMHDAGGNRAQTVGALKIVIPRLRAAGYRFVLVSQLAGLPRSEVELPASGSDRLRGHLLLGGLLVSRVATTILNVCVVIVGVLVALRMLAVLALAHRHVRRRRVAGARGGGRDSFPPPVSIVVPAYNEQLGIGRAVRSLAKSPYPNDFDVVVVDDGSSDRTAQIVEAMALPNVRLIRQPNAGKAAALNRGIAAAEHEILITVDADTVFEEQTLERLVAGFAEPDVGAVSGNTKVGNRKRMLGRWQHIEYVMGFNLDRRMYEVLDCMPTVPGAIGGFRRAALQQSGGVSSATLAEDTDITMAIGRRGWRVVYVDDARAWTEAPETLGQLWRQRYRWAFGTIQSVWKHKGAARHPRESKIGRRALPYLALFQILLPILAPVIDLFAIYGLLFLNPVTVLVYWGGFNLFQLVLAIYAFHLDGESLRPLWSMPLQQFVYRQLMYLVVIESIISALLGTRLRWGHLERTGHVEVAG
jgi:cellulose synthase/poly-beta-1,6-N-acetylglucosamine synthase-like glycosyltransferase/peptidoglycan/xylan/chitin deacetylase (PgdA/CDA1 family)